MKGRGPNALALPYSPRHGLLPERQATFELVARKGRMAAHRRALVMDDGGTVEIVFPPPSRRSSFFAFSLNKAGSTLLHNMLKEYCARTEVAVVDIPTALFQTGVRLNTVTPASMNAVLQESGYGYLGWRTPLHGIEFDFSRTKNILLVRDPRDRLVSMYFSWAYSHVMPGKGEARKYLREMRERALDFGSVNEWVLGDREVVRRIVAPLNRFHIMLPPSSTRLYRYEDVIYRKKEWLADMLEFLEIDIDRQLVEEIAAKNDLRPESERQDAHVRQVTPGNYKKHMSGKALNYANDMCGDYISLYGYDDESSFAKKLVYAREGREAASILRPLRNMKRLRGSPENS